MALLRRPLSTRSVRLAGALLAVSLLAAGCTGEDPDPTSTDGTVASDDGGADASDQGGAGDATEPSDGGGRTAAAVPVEPIEVTPAPEGFEPPAPCTHEGAHLVSADAPATPELPERGGDVPVIELTGIEGDKAQLTVTIGEGEPRPVEDAAIGETIGLDLWTISITSVCSDQDQVEFDLID